MRVKPHDSPSRIDYGSTIWKQDRQQYDQWSREEFDASSDDDNDTQFSGRISIKDERLRRVLLEIIENELTARQREILSMHFAQNMKVTEIARELGIEKSTVSRTLSSAIDKIYKYMKYTFM